MQGTTTAAPATQGEKVVLLYPGNQLKDQVRDFEDTEGVFDVMRETFFGGK